MSFIDLVQALENQMRFCSEKNNYKCGIYIKNQEQRRIVIETISNLIPTPNRDIELRMSPSCGEARWSNGSVLRIINANDNARGHRIQGAIINNEIDRDIVNCIVMPALRKITLNFERNEYESDSELMSRVYTVDMSYDDVNRAKSKKQQLIYVSSRGYGRTFEWQRDLLDAMRYSMEFKNNNYIKFEKEYMGMWNDYDTPVVEKEVNNDKVLLYEAWGIPKHLITYKTEFINKTKQTYLNIKGEYKSEVIGFENDINVHLRIDTDIYDGYEVHIEDGLITVVLHEIKNEAPVLRDYGITENAEELIFQ